MIGGSIAAGWSRVRSSVLGLNLSHSREIIGQANGRLRHLFPLRPLPGGRRLARLGRAFRTAPLSRQTNPTRFWHSPRFHSRPANLLRPPFCPFARVGLFFLAAALVKEKTSRHRQKGKNMKLEEVNLKTKEAVDYLVQSLESGPSAVLTQYLGAMAKFRNYSFGNIMLIARQKPDATNVAGYRTWTSLGRFVRRGEKGIFILAPMVGNKRKKNENQAENAEQTTDAKETRPALYGFRGVYVFDRLSRDLRPSLCAPDGCPE